MPKSRSTPETCFPPCTSDARRSQKYFRDHSPRNRFAIAQGFRLLRMIKSTPDAGRHTTVLKEGAVTWTCKSIVPAPKPRGGRRISRMASAQVRITGLEDRKRVTLSEDWRCR